MACQDIVNAWIEIHEWLASLTHEVNIWPMKFQSKSIREDTLHVIMPSVDICLIKKC